MNLRQALTSLAVTSLAVVGINDVAGAAQPIFTVSDTTITAGGSVTVDLGVPCLVGEEPEYGNVIVSEAGETEEYENQETKGDEFTNGDSGTFHFPDSGTYTISRFCDGSDEWYQVTITVTAPPVTTTTTTSTTVAPSSTTSTTVKPATTTTTAKPATTTTAKPATTTTAATQVAGVSTTKAATKASGATRVASKVAYAG